MLTAGGKIAVQFEQGRRKPRPLEIRKDQRGILTEPHVHGGACNQRRLPHRRARMALLGTLTGLFGHGDLKKL
jgi:hypothetical protein